MKDCEELIHDLRYHAEHPWLWCEAAAEDCGKAAGVIEEFARDIDALTKERDAAMADITHNCKSCIKECGIFDALDRLHDGECDEWVWRGAGNNKEVSENA